MLSQHHTPPAQQPHHQIAEYLNNHTTSAPNCTYLLRRIQLSSLGITNLAKETSSLQYKRDVTGATCINQYVVIKALGRGSFGKVKLCLNTLDGQMYAIKVGTSFICVCLCVCVLSNEHNPECLACTVLGVKYLLIGGWVCLSVGGGGGGCDQCMQMQFS